MKVGQKIKFNFANDDKEGVVERLTDKKVYLRVDFPRHKNKLVIRKITALEADVESNKKKEKGKKEKKEKGKKEKKEKK